MIWRKTGRFECKVMTQHDVGQDKERASVWKILTHLPRRQTRFVWQACFCFWEVRKGSAPHTWTHIMLPYIKSGHPSCPATPATACCYYCCLRVRGVLASLMLLLFYSDMYKTLKKVLEENWRHNIHQSFVFPFPSGRQSGMGIATASVAICQEWR